MIDDTYMRQAYTLRENDLPWEDIALEVIGEEGRHHEMTVQAAAAYYAQKNDLPWPIPSNPLGRRAYELAQHHPWYAVAMVLGTTLGKARHRAKKYALKNKLRWPLSDRGDKDRSRPLRAYEMYRDTHMTWAEVAKELGYKTPTSPCNCARTYALKNNLPWPIKKEDTP